MNNPNRTLAQHPLFRRVKALMAAEKDLVSPTVGPLVDAWHGG